MKYKIKNTDFQNEIELLKCILETKRELTVANKNSTNFIPLIKDKECILLVK